MGDESVTGAGGTGFSCERGGMRSPAVGAIVAGELPVTELCGVWSAATLWESDLVAEVVPSRFSDVGADVEALPDWGASRAFLRGGL